MKHILRKWLAAALAVCMLLAMLPVTSASAATSTTYYATMSAYTMTESGSITVTFSTTCSTQKYYQVKIADSGWNSTYVEENVTSGNTYTISKSNISELSAGNTYHIYVGYWENNSFKYDALPDTTFTVTEDDSGSGDSGSSVTYTNGNYSVTITPSATTCEVNGTITFTISVTYNGSEVTLSSNSVTVWLWADAWASGHTEDGLTNCTISPNDGVSTTVTVTYPSEGTYYMAFNLNTSSQSDYIKATDVATITVTESTSTPSEELTTGTIDDCEFMRGMDLSTFYVNWTQGVTYYDYSGNEYSQDKDNAVEFFEFLYNTCGVNWVRIRVWNDPTDDNGNVYGGGNNDVETAAIIGAWASEAGMSVLIDFHYSDFWADPNHQLAPKAWSSMTISEKVNALYDYTYDSLEYLLEAGVNVGMVQVGNETNGALCGEEITTWSDYENNEDWQNIVKLFKSGSKAVRQISSDYNTTIKVALHFTDPNNDTPYWYAGLLNDAGVDYDAMGISYYMYWHGTLSNLETEMEKIASTYGKEVFIAETAYPYSSGNYDNMANQTTTFDNFSYNANLYAISEKGQEAALTAILDTAVNASGCTGMFYWEAAWTVLNTDAYREAGGGWATIEGGAYISDTMTADEGSSFDNQTLFNSNGEPLAGLKFYADYVEGVDNLPKHNWAVESTTEATQTSYGITTYKCSVCKEEKIVLTSYDGPKFYTRTLTLDGGIGLNYYVNPNGHEDDMTYYSVRFTITDADGGTETTTVDFNADYYRTDLGIDTAYRFTCYVDSVQLGDSVYVELLYNGDTSNPNYVVRTNTYKVQTYCEKAITNSWSEAALCAALLNYGGYAQTEFSYNTGALANANIASCYTSAGGSWSDKVTDGSFDSVDLSSYEAKLTDVSDVAVSLTLKSETSLRLYFSSDYTFTVDGEELKRQSVTSADTGYTGYTYYVELKIPAKYLDKTYTFTESDGGTVQCSALSYVYEQTKSGSSAVEALQNVCKAIYYYSVAASSYKSWV